jgi:ribonuclease HII
MEIKKYPNFKEESNLWKRGIRVVVGLDEAGRGPLAGPVMAAAVAVRKFPISNLQFQEIKDSKKLSAKKREEWYEILTAHPDIQWGVGIVSEKIIDRINIFEATKLAMIKAIEDLEIEPEFLLLDGNFTLEELSISQKAIVRGDEKVFSCAAASIIAKVTRDRLMCRQAKKYPAYGFEKHKGYGTRKHIEAIKEYGPSTLHRKSFRPIKLTFIKKRNYSK